MKELATPLANMSHSPHFLNKNLLGTEWVPMVDLGHMHMAIDKTDRFALWMYILVQKPANKQT